MKRVKIGEFRNRAVPAHERVGIAAICLQEAAWHLARGCILVNDTLGPWPLWLRAAATSPQIQILPLTVDVAIESEQLGDAFPPDPADGSSPRRPACTSSRSSRPTGRSGKAAR